MQMLMQQPCRICSFKAACLQEVLFRTGGDTSVDSSGFKFSYNGRPWLFVLLAPPVDRVIFLDDDLVASLTVVDSRAIRYLATSRQ